MGDLPAKQREYLSSVYSDIAPNRKPPNGCFVLTSRQTAQDGGPIFLPVGFIYWESHRPGKVGLDFFRAPDSGYSVYLTIRADTVQGTGEFWSGNGPDAQVPPDSITGRRTGPPDPALCINAAKHVTAK
jgi:hypothetical protein